MLVNGRKLEAVAHVMAKTSNHTYALMNLFISHDKTINASNGFSLYWASCESDEMLKEFPGMEEKEYSVLLPLLIPGAAVKKALSNLPNKKSLAILQNVAIDCPWGSDKITLTTTDLNTTDNVQVKTYPNDNYPDVDRIKVLQKDTSHTIHLSIDELSNLVSVAKKLGLKGFDTIKLSIGDKESPVFVEMTADDATVNGMIMPVIL